MNTHNGHDWVDYATALGTVFGAIVVALYTFVAYWQARLTDKMLAETQESNKTTKDSLEFGRRAYLIPARIEYPEHRSQNDNSCAIMIENVGGVPATDIKVWCRTGVEQDLPDTFTPIESDTLSINALLGGRSWEIPCEEPQGKGAFVYCKVRYNNGFDKVKTSSTCWIKRRMEWVREPKHCDLD